MRWLNIPAKYSFCSICRGYGAKWLSPYIYAVSLSDSTLIPAAGQPLPAHGNGSSGRRRPSALQGVCPSTTGPDDKGKKNSSAALDIHPHLRSLVNREAAG